MPGDLMLSKLVIDIFLIFSNTELVERLRCSPKLMIFETDNFLRSLCDLSHAVALLLLLLLFVIWFIEFVLLLLLFVCNEGEGDVGLCSNGNDNEDLFFAFSSCSSIVAGILLLTLFDVNNNVCFSSSPFNWVCCCCCCCGCKSNWELGLIGGVPGETIEMGGGGAWGGGEGVGELIDSWFVRIIESLSGESGGSEIQIDACCIVNLLSSWVDFY